MGSVSIVAWSERDPLKAYVRRQAVVDVRLRRILLAASRDAGRRIVGVDSATGLRRAQLQLASEMLRMWAEIGTVVEDGIVNSDAALAQVNASFTDDLLRQIGVQGNDYFRQQMLRSARNSLRAYIAREHHGMALSERVYRNGTVASGRIDRLVANGILRGASAREIARDVAGLINPNTPGGVSYAAMRLGRTELNNAFHGASAESYAANPFVNMVEWSLSSSHPRPDTCDDLVGEYPPTEVPDKPHPQCFCYISPVAMSKTELIRRFKSGEFDAYADAQAA